MKKTKTNKLPSAYSIAYFTKDELIAELQRRSVWVLAISKAEAEEHKQEKITSGDWEKIRILNKELDQSGISK
jgi:hypothetical protein